MKDIFEIKNWVSEDELNQISKIANNWIPVEFRPNYGRFSTELIAIQRWHTWNNSDELGVLLNDRMQQVFGNNLKVIEVSLKPELNFGVFFCLNAPPVKLPVLKAVFTFIDNGGM